MKLVKQAIKTYKGRTICALLQLLPFYTLKGPAVFWHLFGRCLLAPCQKIVLQATFLCYNCIASTFAYSMFEKGPVIVPRRGN